MKTVLQLAAIQRIVKAETVQKQSKTIFTYKLLFNQQRQINSIRSCSHTLNIRQSYLTPNFEQRHIQ